MMKREILYLTLLLLASLAISRFTVLPGGLIGMALLFVLLKKGLVHEDHFPVVTPFLLMHIGFFFVPPSARLVEELPALKGVAGRLVIILVISNMLVMGVTGAVVQQVLKRSKENA